MFIYVILYPAGTGLNVMIKTKKSKKRKSKLTLDAVLLHEYLEERILLSRVEEDWVASYIIN